MSAPFCRITSLLTAGCMAVFLSACGRAQVPATQQQAPSSSRNAAAIATPAVISLNYMTGRLEYWPIGPRGNSHPRTIADLNTGIPDGMAANGNVVVIGNEIPPEVLAYDVDSNRQTVLSDAHGYPVDVAIGREGSIYVANVARGTASGNVIEYPDGKGPGQVLSCGLLVNPEYVAVDIDGNVFVNGYGHQNETGVYEIPASHAACTKLDLQPETSGYVAGIAYDPKTGSLLVMDNPGECAGGINGRIRIYPKPYSKGTYTTVNMLFSMCTGWLRLDAASSIMLVEDNYLNEIFQKGYPPREGTFRGAYTNGGDQGLGGVTTIPNTLPN